MNTYLGNYTKIFSKQIFLNKQIDDENLRLVYGDFRKLYIIDITDITQDQLNDVYIFYNNINKIEYIDNNVRFYYYNSDHIVYPYVHFKSIDYMKNDIRCVSRYNHFCRDPPNNYTRSCLIAKVDIVLDGDIKRYYMNYYINNKIIENLLTYKREIKAHLFTTILIEQKYNILQKINANLLDEILSNLPENLDHSKLIFDDVLQDSVSLYSYQKSDVLWMRSIEMDVLQSKNKIMYEYSPAYGVFDNKFLIYENRLLPMGIGVNNFNNNVIFEYYGGNLISEVGLGKTLIMLYHIISDNIENIAVNVLYSNYVEFADNCNYFYKRGKLKGMNCQKNKITDLYCKDHKSTPFLDKRCIKLRNIENFDIKRYIYTIGNVDYIKTNASMIICPNHLCDQWVQEYYSKFNGRERILLVVTADQYDNLTFADILFADIIILSYNFVCNKKYKHLTINDNLRSITKNILGNISIYDDITTQNKIDLLNSKALKNFELFFWNRLVLDEIHEIQTSHCSDQLKTSIRNLKSKFRWNITATPFTNGVSGFINMMNNISSYGKNFIYNKNLDTNDLIELGMESNIVKKCNFLFRRNTKVSIVDEYGGNVIKDFIKLLDFTVHERSIYDSYAKNSKTNYYDFLIKLCCHPELNSDTKDIIRNCKTFEEIQKCMLEYNEKLMNNEHHTYINCKTEVDYYTEEISKIGEAKTESEIDLLNTLKVKLANYKRQYTTHKKNYDDICRTYNYLKMSIENLKSNDDLTCPICLDDIDKDNITITKCGHKFCWDCIYETYKVQTNSTGFNKIKCPTCNSLMSNTELYIIKNTNTIIDDSSELNTLIQNIKSTKIGNIIHFLKTSIKKDDKVILFSQWDEILKKVGNILTEQKLKIVYCNGTVYQKKKAIRNFFKNDEINIILLSSKNAASGINLTIANKIILLEPIYGSKEFRQNIESQALGRADRIGQKRPIDVYRFLIKDTVEEDLYKNDVNLENNNV